MELPRPDPEKHGPIRITTSSLPFEFNDVSDVLELGLRATGIFPGFTTESPKDISSFIFTANFGEPTGRFGEDPNDEEQEKQWYDLEADRKAPGKCRGTPLKFPQATIAGKQVL